MAEDPLKVYKATVIDDNPFPGQVEEDLDTSQKTSNEEYSNTAIESQSLSRGVTASQVVSNSLNTISRKITNSFTFTQSGAIQIGNYKDGTSGDIRISPDGITARDITGETTFSLDGTTGDATFKGTIVAGSLLLDTFIQIGSGTSVFRADDQGIYLGNETFALAPFRVNLSGDVTASSLTLTNASVGAGSAYTGNPIGNLYLDSISATKITAGTLDSGVINTGNLNADNINAGTINASVINVTNLNATNLVTGDVPTAQLTSNTLTALQATVGTLSAIVVNAGDILVGGSGDGLGTITVRNSGGTEITKLNNNGIIVRNTRGLFFESTVGGNYWVLENNASNHAVMSLPNSNQFFIKDDAGTTNLFTVSSTKTFSDNELWINSDLKFGTGTVIQEHNVEGINWLLGYNDLNFRVTGTNRMFFDSTTEAVSPGDLTMFPHWGDFYATGTKYFRIPHPDNPKTQWLQYVSVESPEVALRMRGKATLVNGKVSVYLPNHWKLVTVDDLTTINLTPLGDCNGLYAYSLSNKKFEIREINGGTSGVDFTWELSAIREGYGNFNPEQTVDAEAQRAVDDLVEGEKDVKLSEKARKEKTEKHSLYQKLVAEKYEEQTGRKYKEK